MPRGKPSDKGKQPAKKPAAKPKAKTPMVEETESEQDQPIGETNSAGASKDNPQGPLDAPKGDEITDNQEAARGTGPQQLPQAKDQDFPRAP